MTERRQAWLFSPAVDVGVFAGSALASILFVAVARALGIEGETPVWAFLLLVVGVDVSHVWATLYRVYFDGAEVARRPLLYFAVPAAAYVAGFLAYQQSSALFWRLFAYAALFHFIRQQYGWVALYNRKANSPKWERWLDAAVIYGCTLGPAIWWHANLPRPFWWFVSNDFVALPHVFGTIALGGMWLALGAWSVGQILRARRGIFWGRVLLVLATFASWYGGIVVAQDDLAFTAMNVALHGIPYFALLHRYAKNRAREKTPYAGATPLRFGLFGFLLVLLALAYLEEGLWDRFVWHEHASLFGSVPFDAGSLLPFIVPLLALPQATHYVLDAFIWKPKQDSALLGRLGWVRSVGDVGQVAPAPLLAGEKSHPVLPS
ncbi:MAG: hypothetical protein ACJ790_02570 [Myxococcaceae bacterium]